MYSRKPRPNYSSARPAGASDSDESSDDDGYYGPGFSKSTSKYKAVDSTGTALSNATTTAVTNGHAVEDWEAEDDTPQSTGEYWGATPQETVRLACTRGNLEKLKEELSKDLKYNVNKFFNERDQNPLITACLNGSFEIVEYLLTDKSANPNVMHPTSRITPILALAGCSLEIEEETLIKCATELVKAGANVDTQDNFGMSALMVTVKRQRPKLMEYLLKAGANPNITDPDDQTALFFAVMEGDGRMCRRLLEYDADINMENKYGWSVPELAQDKNYPELANLLFLVRDTKWKPGLHPALMKELDEVAAAERKARNEDSVMEDSSILLMLQAVDGEKYHSNFRKHKISYIHFLTLDDEQLKEIGVDEVGVRERLLDNIKKINNAQWQPGSIRNIATNKNVTAAEAVCMIVNINEHLDHITSSLLYVTKRVKQNPLALQYDIERNRLEDLMKFCEQTEFKSRQVRQSILELHRLIGEYQGYTELQIVGRIPRRNFNQQRRIVNKSTFQWKFADNIVTGVGLVSICLFFGLKYLKRISN